VVEAIPRKTWTPLGIVRRFGALIRKPSDAALTLRIAWFMWHASGKLARVGLPGELDRIRSLARPACDDADAGVERIARLRRPWFGLPALRGHDTCYMRALTLYRFLGTPSGDLRIHFVIEPGDEPGARPRGHAWVTLAGRILEEPPELADEGRTRGLYTHPA